MSCNNGKSCRYIVGYQVDGGLIPLLLKTPKNISSYGVSQYDKHSAYTMPFNVSEAREWVSQYKKIWNEKKTCEMALAMPSSLLWASSLMESCFSCFTVKVLKDFRVMTVARERSRLVPLKAMPTGRPTPPANAAIEIPPVINVDVIKPVSRIPVIVLNRFIFLAIRSRTSISSR